MKKRTGIITLLLALSLVLSLSVAAFADGAAGSITISNAVKDRTYTIYRILDLESYDAEAGTYAYKAASPAWSAFLASDGIAGVYVNVNTQGYVTWVQDSKGNKADPAAFARLAHAYAVDPQNQVPSQGTETASSTTVKFENLALGYYLVDSNQGVLCGLSTTNPDAVMEEKNGVPTGEKEVEEDSTLAFGHVNDADIGQTVHFKSTILTQPGAENYVFQDKMSAGLTFDGSVTVTLEGETVDPKYYTLRTTGVTAGYTFEVLFTQEFCDTLSENGELVIHYSATVNAQAVVAGDGNPNESRLVYGEDGEFKTTPSVTKTYTWGLDVLKYANGDEKKRLEGVRFVLLNFDKSKAAVVINGKLTGWAAVPEDGAAWPANTELTTDADGRISVDGLDADTYYLRETAGKPGFNKLDGDVAVTITAESTDGTTMRYTRPEEKINNNSGTLLPSTGGMGTAIFYAAGGILVLGAGVLLVTRKRMEA